MKLNDITEQSNIILFTDNIKNQVENNVRFKMSYNIGKQVYTELTSLKWKQSNISELTSIRNTITETLDENRIEQ